MGWISAGAAERLDTGAHDPRREMESQDSINKREADRRAWSAAFNSGLFVENRSERESEEIAEKVLSSAKGALRAAEKESAARKEEGTEKVAVVFAKNSPEFNVQLDSKGNGTFRVPEPKGSEFFPAEGWEEWLWDSLTVEVGEWECDLPSEGETLGELRFPPKDHDTSAVKAAAEAVKAAGDSLVAAKAAAREEERREHDRMIEFGRELISKESSKETTSFEITGQPMILKDHIKEDGDVFIESEGNVFVRASLADEKEDFADEAELVEDWGSSVLYISAGDCDKLSPDAVIAFSYSI